MKWIFAIYEGVEEGRGVYLPAGWRKGAYKIRESIKYIFVCLIATHPM